MSDPIDLGAYVYDEGYFLLRSAAGGDRTRATSPVAYRPSVDTAGAYRHVFSYRQSGPTIKEAVLRLLTSAEHKVFVASFRIGDAELLKALYDAAERLRGGVYVISALDEQSLRRGLQSEDADAPDADDLRAQNKRFEDMTSRGISVRGHDNFHAKFLVVDDREALVSSANLETSALAGTAQRAVTGENGFVVSDQDEVTRLGRYFTRLWHACSYEMPPGEGHTVQERSPSPSPCRVPSLDRPPGMIWTYPSEAGILQAIHGVIGEARRELLLASFSLNGITDRPELLLDPLEAAMRDRAPRVSLFVRGRNNHPSTRRDAKTLSELGVRIYADSLTHAKAAIADGRYGALFSANFDADHGLTSGAETGVVLSDHPALGEAVRYLGHAMSNADLTFSPAPTQREMDGGLAAGWRTAWPFSHEIRLTCPDGIWRAFSVAAGRGPVLYVKTEDQVLLHAGEGQWRLVGPDARGLSRLEDAGHGNPQLLDSWLSARNQRPPVKSGRRGFCPAVILRTHADEDQRRER